MSIREDAIAKLKAELEKKDKLSQKANAVKKYVFETLKSFCEQDEEFSQAIVQSESTLSQCCESVVKGVGTHVSDIDIYKKAVQFYFSTATIHFNMQIDLSGGNGYEAPPIEMHKSEPVVEQPKQSLALSLDDLLGDF